MNVEENVTFGDGNWTMTCQPENGKWVVKQLILPPSTGKMICYVFVNKEHIITYWHDEGVYGGEV